METHTNVDKETAAPGRRWLGLAMLAVGLLATGTGVYFMVLRPPLLPEDLRFAGVSAAEIPRGLLRWLAVVFRTWGGFMLGFGLCILGQAAHCLSHRPMWLQLGTGLGLVTAFGSFLVSNIQLRSAFIWFVAFSFVAAVMAAVLLLRRDALAPAGTPRSDARLP